jgi:hypothetical protein
VHDVYIYSLHENRDIKYVVVALAGTVLYYSIFAGRSSKMTHIREVRFTGLFFLYICMRFLDGNDVAWPYQMS